MLCGCDALSDLNAKPVIGEMEALRESLVRIVVRADVVGEMSEICVLCSNPATECDGIIYKLMAMVWFLKA